MFAIEELRLRDWRPRSQLRTPHTEVAVPLVPCIDAHNHLGRWLSDDGDWIVPDVGALLAMMDAQHVETIVNLDGMTGDELEANLDRLDRAHPGRFATFCQLDWTLLARPDGVRLLIAALEDSARRGARGVKVWKTLGLHVRDAAGALVSPDDDRVVAVLARAGELGLPVLIHTADPIAFFQPLDAHNERLDELAGQPDWWFGDPDRYPSFDTLLDAHSRLVLACPGTTFIGAHVGCCAEDLDRVARLLDAAPHYHVDIAGRLAELGRQPRHAAAFIARYADRVLFGTDCYPASAAQYRLHYRFLETCDEAFDYAPEEEIPPQGRWTVSGLGLSPDVLEKVYRGNAHRVLGTA
ncbi:MAG: amidohydrolase family protein [Propionicimonas sp.]|uniref:amidohydrolase family protein n=1 Tax=Propionicimonas sp. TaxID=1955623 RepID=UPI003D099023